MRFNRGTNVRFHFALWWVNTFTQSGSKMSRLFLADAHRDGKRFVVRAEEKLTAFVGVESAISARGQFH